MKSSWSKLKASRASFRMDRGSLSDSLLRMTLIGKTLKRSTGTLAETVSFTSNPRARLDSPQVEAVSSQFPLEKRKDRFVTPALVENGESTGRATKLQQ
jgi:hypothetical protein